MIPDSVICYTDSAGCKVWDVLNASAETAVEQVKKADPGAVIQYVFNQAQSTFADSDTKYRRQFEDMAYMYGVKPSDWNAELRFGNGAVGRLRGIDPSRRKYVFRVWDPAKQSYVLYSRRAVLSALACGQTA